MEKEEAPATRIFAEGPLTDLQKQLDLDTKPADDAGPLHEAQSMKDLMSKPIDRLGTANPIADFNAMMTNRKTDLVSRGKKRP